MKKHFIVGSGAAGLAALKQIRSVSADDEIKIVTREKSPPYSPTALPYLLSGKIDEAKLWVVDDSFFQETKSNFAPGKEVVQILPAEKKVVYKDGEKEMYDTLLVATGSEPVMPGIKGIDTIGALGFHTLEDYRKLSARLNKNTRTLVYGGGLVAMGIAQGLIKRGCKVTLIVRSRVLRKYFDAEAGNIITDIFLKQGAQIILGKEINKLSKSGNAIEAVLSDGSKLAAEVFISCLGTTPRVPYLKGSEIALSNDGGVIVDDHMQTNREAVYAAGDIAVSKDFFTGKPGINAILPSAVEQGKIAGSNMAGDQQEYQGWISMNVFHFFGNGACSMGILENGKSLEVMKDMDKNKGWFKKLAFQDNRLVGAEFVNIEVDPGVVLYSIKNRLNIGKDKELLFQKPIDMSRYLMLKNERGV